MKLWYLSKTLWFNVVALAFEAAYQTLQPLQELLPENHRAYFAFIVVFGNLLLRFLTTQPLGLSR